MIYSVVQRKDKNDQDVDIEVKFNVGDLRRILELGDSDNDPTIIPERLCKGLWYRMGFAGHVNGKYLKSMFSPPYKFLIHCVMHALSHRKGAYDETSDYIMNIITCLVLNRPYNVSQVLLDRLDPANILGLRHITAETLGRLTTYKGLKKDESEPRVGRMIYKIANPGYVAPENDAWRHDNSNSKDETDRLRDMHEKKLRYWFVKDRKKKRTPKTSPAISIPKVSTPKIVVKGPSKKSPPRLVDELVLDSSEVLQQGVGLLKDSLESYLKKNEEAQAEKAPKNVESSAKHVEPKGVVHSDSSDADDESTETEPEIDMSKVGHGKVQLKKKPQKKRKGSDEEDSTYMPTAKEKKKLRTKRKAVQSGVIPRNVRAKKAGATMPESQSGKKEKHVTTSKGPAAVIDQNAEVPEVQSVEKPEAEKEKVPENPEYVRIEKKGAYDAESLRPKKTTLPDLSEGFPNVHGEYTDDILLDEDYDMFHDATVKDLKKKVSLLENEKAKAEVDRDELKKQLEELTKLNEEIKAIVIKHAQKIKTLGEDVDDNAKLFEQLSMEISELHEKNGSLNETNQMLHQMLSDLHEASSNEIKVMKLEVEALRAHKAVKDEQLNMLYTVMEHHLGINVQSIYNNIEIQRVEERRAQREKELAEAATQKKKEVIIETQEAGGSSSQPDVEMVDAEVDPQGFVLVGEATPLSYNFDNIIRLVQVEQRKRKAKEPEVLLLRWKEEEKEEEKIEDKELEDVLDAVDSYDDQGSTGLLIVNPFVQQQFDDFLNDEINEQEEDHHEESSSGKKHADQVFLTQPTVIYLNAPVEGEI
ncbi:hypothetical protein HanXRQr2_Chr14g0635451 [Helianthus annuus]|uniref:Uncharacterized protein n=1 Tax=Helianthus annuus TaxID=4232 RepID=A0A9K3H5T8_HELAN|nr:hypothetical protein HanXRQr2_Chr14g0635451 [Helianthus annuus]KAJ0485124.1 hypothetical protein HanHA89_Chr14g0564641 [Helianthus annuus]KAJ0655674.1 hypothetical protein HanLR1_Chr14g0526981 [Helianthus annuus]KAJ0659359.1 hypothetical protein HanOQP8_Chr14g0525181 [Helianthus annuus]